jgi:hypothetical protein
MSRNYSFPFLASLLTGNFYEATHYFEMNIYFSKQDGLAD